MLKSEPNNCKVSINYIKDALYNFTHYLDSIMDDKPDLERLYSPSQWSKTPNALQSHIDFLTNVTQKNRNEIPCSLNLRYGNKEKQKFDVYGTDLPKDSSLFVFLHGGYWQQLNKDISGFVAAPFYKNKIKSIIVGYTLCPDTTVKEIGEEIKLAMRKIIDYAKKNGVKNIYISGYSAGAQLIAILFTDFYKSLSREEKSLIRATILCCGVYDLTPLIHTTKNKPLNLTYDTAKEVSPMFDELKEILDFNIYVVIGDIDSPAYQEQSKLYYEKLQKVCKNVDFKLIPGLDHFKIVEHYNNDDYELLEYILKFENRK